MGKSSSSGGKTTSTVVPWAPAQKALQDILSQAGELYDQQGGINQEFVQRHIADLTPEMQSAVKDIIGSDEIRNIAKSTQQAAGQGTAGIGQASGVLGSLASGKTGQITGEQINNLTKQLYDTDLVKEQKSQLAQDVNQQMLGDIQGVNQQATSAGQMGSSRAGVMEAVAREKAGKATATGEAAIDTAARQAAQQGALGTLQQNVATQAQGAQSLGSLGISSGSLGLQTTQAYQQALANQLQGAGITQTQAQNQQDIDWFNKQGQQQQGWVNLGNYLNTAGTVGGMGGSTVGKAQQGSASTTQGILGGAASGAALGGTIGGPWGAAVGGAAGGIMGAFSDASLKKDVKATGKETATGEKEYTWKWNESAKKRVGKGRLGDKTKGVLAQQVAKDNPKAVGKDKKTGRLMVDYSKV